MNPCSFLAVFGGSLNAPSFTPKVFTTLTTPILSATRKSEAVYKRAYVRRTVYKHNENVSCLMQFFLWCGRSIELDLVLFQCREERKLRLEDPRDVALYDAVFVFGQTCADEVRQNYQNQSISI